MSQSDHLPGALLVRALDKESRDEETSLVAEHLAICSECRRQFNLLAEASATVEELLTAVPAVSLPSERELLREKIIRSEREKTASHSAGRVMRRFGLGMALAATLAIGIIIAPRPGKQRLGYEQAEVQTAAAQSSAFEVDGETFVALPYSNPDLPVNSQRIVRMQVPVSTLTDIGIVLEPVNNRIAEQDASVMADVLVGTDGQPVGVHVLNVE